MPRPGTTPSHGPCSSAITSRHRGFTLIEVLVVVVILAVLATIVIASFAVSVDDAKKSAFVSNLRAFARAAERYSFETGEYLEDSSSGELPADFDQYVNVGSWVGGTPIGGVWDAEFNSFGVASALGVHFDGTGETRDDAYMTTIDDIFDDGDLATGAFRKLAGDRYYHIIAE